MKIELVVFDIAGTTVIDQGEIALSFQSALLDFGYHVPVTSINPLMGYKKTEAISKILHEFEHDKELITTSLILEIHHQFQEIMMEYYATTPSLQATPFAEEIFAYLHSKKIKVALDTGFSKEITSIIIDRLGWLKDQKIDSYICSNEVSKGRPYPYMIFNLMEQLEITSTDKVIKVGDTEVDVNEGHNAGCKYSIGITTGAYTEAELKPHFPSFIIADLKELIQIIEPLT